LKRKALLSLCGIALAGTAGSGASAAAPPDAEALYRVSCGTCHDRAPKPGEARRPRREDLAAMTADAVLKSLTSGLMVDQAVMLSPEEKAAVAVFVTGKPLSGPGEAKPTGRCTPAAAALGDPLSRPHWNGWGADALNSRFQRAEMARLTAADVPRLKLKWAFGFPGATRAWSQPTVAGGRVFVAGQGGAVYALDAQRGCIVWQHQPDGEVRSAISVGPAGAPAGTATGAAARAAAVPPRFAVYFGDSKANVTALDAETGEPLWKTHVDDHASARLTGAPLLHAGRLYVPVSSHEEVAAGNPKYECCTFRGSVVALDAVTGRQLWKTYAIADAPKPVRLNKNGTQLWGPSGGAIWSTPTLDVDKGVLYVGTGNAYMDPAPATTDAVLALEASTGRLLWSRQPQAGDHWNFSCPSPDKVNCGDPAGPDFDIGVSPILRRLPGGRSILVVGQKSGMVYGLDPDHEGKIVWEARVGQGSALGGVEWGPAADDQAAYIAVSDVVAPKPQEAGGLFALKLATGEKVWTAAPKPECTDPAKRGCTGAQSAAVTVIPGVVFSGGLDGHLRAYSTSDGGVLWDVNTVREYETVNGVVAKGGSLDAAGPTVVDGIVYVNSGYGLFRGIAGNVLLAFSVDGK
jgi:polyvinyl alcohol dehydrogenase (cytochrome)